MTPFKNKVLEVVKRIKKGEFLSYKEIAKRAGRENAARAVGQILARNKDRSIPCHRVILSNGLVGGFFGEIQADWKKAALLLKEGAIGVIPTDTIYGICTSAFWQKSVEKIYRLKRRNPQKPCLILISNFSDLKKFGVRLSPEQKKILNEIWPGKISAILPCFSQKFSYLHRGTKTLAFRLPKQKLILNILEISGPLLAPSCNWEGEEPAKNIREARRYFKEKVFYLDRGNLTSRPSTIIDLTRKKMTIVRKGAEYKKVERLLSKISL